MQAMFPLLGEPVAVDLANTLVAEGDRLSDRLADDAHVAAWLEAHRDGLPERALAEPPSPAALRQLRDAIRELLHAAVDARPPDPQAVALVNRTGASAPAPELTWSPDGFKLAAGSQGLDGGAAALAAIARSAIDLLSSQDADRLRRCDGRGCVLLFVARHPQRHFCSPNLCGTRSRVARHRERQRSATRDQAR